MKIQNVKLIDMFDWDKCVTETYGKPYVFQQQDGCKSRGVFHLTVPCEWIDDYENDTVPEIVNGEERGVSFAAWLARDPKTPLEDGRDDFGLRLWWERNFYPEVGMIADDLHEKGILPAGEYAINIDW